MAHHTLDGMQQAVEFREQLAMYLRFELHKYALHEPAIWADTAAVHFVLRVTHPAGKYRLLALLSLLSTCIHHAAVVILVSGKAAQQVLLQAIQQVDQEIKLTQLCPDTATVSATEQATTVQSTTRHQQQASTHPARLHAESLVLSCGSHITVIRDLNSAPAAASNSKYLFMIADHDLCVDDAYLRNFWTRLRLAQQVSPLQQQHLPATQLLHPVFGQLGSLWRIISTTYSLPGLASTLTDSQEPDFTTECILTGPPCQCTAHPCLQLEGPDMQEVQLRTVPTAAATIVQSRATDYQLHSWFGSKPGLLQWLTLLTELAAEAETSNAVDKSDPKLMLVVASQGVEPIVIMDHVQKSSSMHLAILGCDMDDFPSMLVTTGDCFPAVMNSFDPELLDEEHKQSTIHRVANHLHPPVTQLKRGKSVFHRIQAMQNALSVAQAQHGQPIHGLLIMSWETLPKLLTHQAGRQVTDLYLADLAESVPGESQHALTHMCASALALVTSIVSRDHDRGSQLPKLWMDFGSHNLLNVFLEEANQMFEEGEVIQMKEHLEMSLRAQINAKGNFELRDMLRDHLEVLLEEKPDNAAIRKLSTEVSSGQSYWQSAMSHEELAAFANRVPLARR